MGFPSLVVVFFCVVFGFFFFSPPFEMLSASPFLFSLSKIGPRQTADIHKQVGRNVNVCASLLTGLSWSLASAFQRVIGARAVVSDAVMGQGGQSVDTLESEGQLGKSSFA